jgi:hypothetical protein
VRDYFFGKTLYLGMQLGCKVTHIQSIRSNPSPATVAVFTPVQKYVVLESQKMMRFEYGQTFKLHERSGAELFKAAVGL